MEGKRTRPNTFGAPTDENNLLSQLIELIEISIGHTHTILYSIEDITRLPKAAASNLRSRDSGYSESRGPISGDDLGRRLLTLERKVEENRTYLRDLHRVDLRGLQIILENPEDVVITDLQYRIRVNFEASNEIRWLAEQSLDLLHISKSDLEDVLPPVVNIRSLKNRLCQIENDWDLPFESHDGRLSLCNSAKLLNSGTNKGVLEYVELRDADKQVLKRRKGTFQFWKCNLCDFRVRYHTTHCNSANIETTDEIRRPGKGHVSLRTVFLAKSHLHKQQGQSLRYACLFCMGTGKRLQGGSTAFAKEDELADHIDIYHDSGSLPRLFMTRLYVAASDEKPTGRCDIQFHRTRSAL